MKDRYGKQVNLPSGVTIDGDSHVIMDGTRVLVGGISLGSVSIRCPKCGSQNVRTHRLTVRSGDVAGPSDIECLHCGERQKTE